MIIFAGTKNRGPVHFVVFRNEEGEEVEVPTDERYCRLLMAHLEVLQPPDQEQVEGRRADVDEASERVEMRRGAKNDRKP
jgi:hypothetical protein